MVLNPDCIRNILLTVEDTSNFNNITEYKIGCMNLIKLNPYSHEEIIYHIRQCDLSGLVYDVHFYDNGDLIDIGDLTPKGHQFLADIRSDKIWNDVKEVGKKIGSTSLNSLTQIATSIITVIIKNQLGM